MPTITVDGAPCLTAAEAAHRLGVHPSGLTRLASRLRGRKLQGWVFPLSELEKLEAERKAHKKTNAQN